MTTLITIPSVSAVHIPTPSATPVPLSTGDLTLLLIPANPPTHPSATVTLSVGSASFPLLPNTPVQRVKAKQEHPSYQFRPIPADGSVPIGVVRLEMADSKSQGAWDATEALCSKLEAELRSHGVWDEKILFVNDEYETASSATAASKGWGEYIASSVMGAASTVAAKLTDYTDSHTPQRPGQAYHPTLENAAKVSAVRQQTALLADKAEQGAQVVGEKIHEAGKKLGENLPDSLAKRSEPVREEDKSEFRKMAEDAWKEVTVAAKGIAGAGVTVGKAVSENAHKAIESNYGRQADGVAQDVGQTGANLGSTALSVGTATSAIIQGSNVASGVSKTAGSGGQSSA